MNELYADFVVKLKKLYGKLDETNNRFEKCSNSEIARELGYSDAQFSRLINESATDGEYQRAIQNLDRIIRVSQLEKELASRKESGWNWKRSWVAVPVAVGMAIIVYFLLGHSADGSSDTSRSRDQMLHWAFENSFINPYSKLEQLPDDCNFPCYKYQGCWTLDKGYKMPFFRERNGFHYLSTEVNMYARCMNEESVAGNMLEGYEYQKHEIWYDRNEVPLDSFVVQGNELHGFYQEMDFSALESFMKVATVHTFFRNEFIISDSIIHRSGKVIGRDLEFESDEYLMEELKSQRLVNEIRNEINRIGSHRLQDFSEPVSCDDSVVPDRNFHNIKDGAKMSFDCELTTNRMAFHYTKTFVLEDQYIKNKCQPSETLN